MPFLCAKQFQKAIRPQLFRISEREESFKRNGAPFAGELTRSFSLPRTYTYILSISTRWPAPLYNLYFDSFLLICTSFVVRTRGIVCVVYLLSRIIVWPMIKTLVNGTWSPILTLKTSSRPCVGYSIHKYQVTQVKEKNE